MTQHCQLIGQWPVRLSGSQAVFEPSLLSSCSETCQLCSVFTHCSVKYGMTGTGEVLNPSLWPYLHKKEIWILTSGFQARLSKVFVQLYGSIGRIYWIYAWSEWHVYFIYIFIKVQIWVFFFFKWCIYENAWFSIQITLYYGILCALHYRGNVHTWNVLLFFTALMKLFSAFPGNLKAGKWKSQALSHYKSKSKCPVILVQW